MKPEDILVVKNLKTFFFLDEGVLKAVDNVSINIKKGETVGIVGESGCGKSVSMFSVLRLVQPPGEIVHGRSLFRCKNGSVVDIFSFDPNDREMLSIRGNEISIIFQEPMTSFSPVYTVGAQITEIILLHRKADKKTAREMGIELLDRVGISNSAQRYDEYPHQLSGGMRQRAMIAMALSCDPQIVIADEPTTALDVTIQAQILKLMQSLQERIGMSIIYISHDIAVISENAKRVYVMYLGRIVESCSVKDLFENALHPYTQRLLKATPRPGKNDTRLEVIGGMVPIPLDPPMMCGFCPRCNNKISGKCDKDIPALVEIEPGHAVRCFLYGDQVEEKDKWSEL
jgi:oligopeptide/dipeptide ABC transporter ATP-binding protein